jgi:hypothetical protein
MPARPSIQITTKAANARRSATTAMPSAPAKVASAGQISSRPDRTMRIARMEATRAKPAMRRAQMASREVGSEWIWRGTIGLPQELEQMLLSAAQSA